MQNAQRHGCPPVSAHVGIEGGSVVLKVCDHGPGLPEGTGERVFEPFFRPQGRSETAAGWDLGACRWCARSPCVTAQPCTTNHHPTAAPALSSRFRQYLDMAGAYPCESRAEGEV
ncbi:ATP-binding protein [Mesorhizobium sp. AR07]|uniref:ATP-binding protein n=1 Tax=Mesorhizobium sp. AR07 TaxID=2865838 RepID=UPI0039B6F59B